MGKVALPGDNSQAVAAALAVDDGRGRADGGGRGSAAGGADEGAWRRGRPARKAMDVAAWWAPWDCSRLAPGSASSTWCVGSGTRSSPGSPSARGIARGSAVRRRTGIWSS